MIRGDGENRRRRENTEKSVFDRAWKAERQQSAAAGNCGKNSMYSAKAGYIAIAVTIAERIHLFSYRTQKLSSLTPKVLRGYPRGRIGSCRIHIAP